MSSTLAGETLGISWRARLSMASRNVLRVRAQWWIMAAVVLQVILSLVLSHAAQASGSVLFSPGSPAIPKPDPGPIYRGETEDKLIALTFDDGLKPASLEILEILQANSAKATWFVTGRSLPGNESILQELIDAKHEFANHTYNHPNLTTLTAEQVKEELQSTAELLRKSVPDYRPYWRPPGGVMSDEVAKVVEGLGLTQILWSMNTYDFVLEKTEDQIYADLISAQPGEIILLHNSPLKNMHRALARALPELAKQGYRFVTVSEILKGATAPLAPRP